LDICAVVIFNWGAAWLDFETMAQNRVIPAFWSGLKWAVHATWQFYHDRVWVYVREVQMKQSELKQAVCEVCEDKELPPEIAETINSFLCTEGVQELDYRWYLHDNRHNEKHVQPLDYKTRECIASFLIPEPAFNLNKDQIVDLYCET